VSAANRRETPLSPIGAALVGSLEGTTVKVQTPGGLQELTVKKVA